MSNAVAGHGALIAVESSPIVAGTFVDIAELTSDLDFGVNRPSTDVTPHNDTIDAHIVGVMRRDPLALVGNFIFDGATHDQATGLQKHWIDGDKFGILFKGPAWAADTDEIIASGYITNFMRTAPNSEGAYGFEATLQPSGPMKIDGVTVGTEAA
jgi:hypothetical protein